MSAFGQMKSTILTVTMLFVQKVAYSHIESLVTAFYDLWYHRVRVELY